MLWPQHCTFHQLAIIKNYYKLISDGLVMREVLLGLTWLTNS